MKQPAAEVPCVFGPLPVQVLQLNGFSRVQESPSMMRIQWTMDLVAMHGRSSRLGFFLSLCSDLGAGCKPLGALAGPLGTSRSLKTGTANDGPGRASLWYSCIGPYIKYLWMIQLPYALLKVQYNCSSVPVARPLPTKPAISSWPRKEKKK